MILKQKCTNRPYSFIHSFMQVHDQTLLHINNHLVNGNGGGNELDGTVGGGGGRNQLNTLKEEILTELERRVSLSCSACQVSLNTSDVLFHSISASLYCVLSGE